MNADNKKMAQALIQQIEVGLGNDTELEDVFFNLVDDALSVTHEINKDVALELEKIGAADTAIEVLKLVPDGVTVQKDTWAARMQKTAGKLAALDITKETRLAIFDLLSMVVLGEHAKELLAEPTTAKNKKRQPKVPFPPNPFDGTNKELELGTALVPNNPHAAHTLRAIIAGGKNEGRKKRGWRNNTIDGAPQYHESLPTWGEGQMLTYFNPQKYNAGELWEKVRAMDSISLDVHLAVMALFCDPRNNARAPSFGWATLHPEQLLKFKAFSRRGNDKRVTIQRVLDAARTLSELNTDIRNIPYTWTKRGKEVTEFVSYRGCKIFHIGSVVYAEQGDLFEHRGGYPEEEKEIIAINIFAGQWAHYWLNTVKDGQHYEWTSLATQVLLQLGDNRTEQAAKRFGALLLTMPGATGVFKTTQEDTHAGVLDAIGELWKDEYRGMVEGEAQKGMHWGQRMEQLLYGGEDSRGNYQQGMFPLLVDLGLLDSFEKPVAELDAGDKGRGWVDRWLALSVRWTSSAAAARMKAAELETAQKSVIEQRVTKPKRPRGTGKTKKALAGAQYFDQTTINAIYAAYRGRNWTQVTFAKELGIAQSTLSNVLNRREAPSPELAAKIRAILDSPIA